MGVELIRRTTRRMHPTPAGFALYNRLKSVLSEIECAKADITRENSTINGLLRIGASVLFAPKFVVPTVIGFVKRFPEVRVDLNLDDSIVDLIECKLDIAIRIGNLGTNSLKARKLAELRRVVVAAPDYLAAFGTPQTPAELGSHRCVVRTFGPEGDVWPVIESGEVNLVQVHGAFRCNDAAAANAAVLMGVGIGLAPLWQVRHDLDEGRLELLLPDYELPPIRVSAVWPGSAETPQRTRLFH